MANRLLDAFQQGRGGPAVSHDDAARADLHTALVSSLDLQVVRSLPREELRGRLRETLTRMVGSRSLPLTREQQAVMVEDLLDDILGLGPLEPLLRDPAATDILVNGPHQVFVERRGVLEKSDVRFRDVDHLMRIIDRIVSSAGRRIDEASPLVDARLPDGSRVHVAIPPAAVDAPLVSIRRFSASKVGTAFLVERGVAPAPVVAFLAAAVRAGANVLVSGGTGSGKTTLLNVLSSAIPVHERIITIEDAAELQLQQEHVLRMETRPPNLEGKGEITARTLVRNALRMRPDRILLGEIRGEEAIDLLQAMNTGHDGSMGTVHANQTAQAVRRMKALVGLGSPNLRDDAIDEMIGDALDLVVQVVRYPDGARRIEEIAQVTRSAEGVLTVTPLYRFTRLAGGRGEGRVLVDRPALADAIEASDDAVPPAWAGHVWIVGEDT